MFCKKNQKFMPYIALGYKKAIDNCKSVFVNEPFQCSTKPIREKTKKKRKGKRNRLQKNEMDVIINQGS